MTTERIWHKFAGGRKYHIITSGSLNPPDMFVTVCDQRHQPTDHLVALRSFESEDKKKCLRCKNSIQTIEEWE